MCERTATYPLLFIQFFLPVFHMQIWVSKVTGLPYSAKGDLEAQKKAKAAISKVSRTKMIAFEAVNLVR